MTTFSLKHKCPRCGGDGLLPDGKCQSISGAKKPQPTACPDCAGTGLRDGKAALDAGATIPQGYGSRIEAAP